MEPAAVREATQQHPFRPFMLRLADGRELPVPHPDFIAIAPNGRRVAVFSPSDDSLAILEPLLIVSLEYAGTGQSAGPATGNGS